MSFSKLILAIPIGCGIYYYLNSKNKQREVDFIKIKGEVQDILWNSSYEDKHLGPLFVRLAWHASGTYDKVSGTGGSNGATMRFPLEANDPANAGLDQARNFLEPIKKHNPQISYADLWVYASYVAIENMGGPQIPFKKGRTDATSEKECPPNGRLPDASQGRDHIREVFYRMGFNDQEIVALVGGGHSMGRCHPKRSGFDGPWNSNPLACTNLFFKELINKEWVVKDWKGPHQFVDKETGKLMMLPTDLEFRDDPEFRKWTELYFNNEKKLLEDFGTVFKKLTELGCKNLQNI